VNVGWVHDTAGFVVTGDGAKDEACKETWAAGGWEHEICDTQEGCGIVNGS